MSQNTNFTASVVDDVLKGVVAGAAAPGVSGKKAFATGVPGSVAEFVPSAVATTIDLAVAVGGPQIAAMIAANKPEIRQFVSERTLEFLRSVIDGLADARL